LRNGIRALSLSIALFETFFVFGLVVFAYVVGLSYWQPYWLDKQVTHLQEGIPWLSWLRNDTMGVIAFMLSITSFFVARYLRVLKNRPRLGL